MRNATGGAGEMRRESTRIDLDKLTSEVERQEEVYDFMEYAEVGFFGNTVSFGTKKGNLTLFAVESTGALQADAAKGKVFKSAATGYWKLVEVEFDAFDTKSARNEPSHPRKERFASEQAYLGLHG